MPPKLQHRVSKGKCMHLGPFALGCPNTVNVTLTHLIEGMLITAAQARKSNSAAG